MKESALLVLEDGTVFNGRSIGVEGTSVGEVVFNTAMTGYQEILTDPSYASQIVTLTYPHIGNVGTNGEDEESARVFSAGLVVRSLPVSHSSWRAEESLPEYLAARDVVAISDIDTRRLTRILRTKGALAGCIAAGDGADADAALASARAFPGLGGMDLARVVTTRSAYRWNRGEADGEWDLQGGHGQAPEPRFRVVACDYGVKRNILRLLADRGCDVTVVPAESGAEEILGHGPDGVFLSNGPGDPEPCDYAIRAIWEIVRRDIPVFGICLGHQLLALASGARTGKMKFGHHGANHPVQDLGTDRVLITSQNHGFTVEEDSLPDNVRVTHRSLFDGTVQGIELLDHPAYSFQGHPEASPGPRDIHGLFDRFIGMMASARGEAQ
ncbi:MAG: glutamine-hydrolyzing carbamoyl-phosphate synthase small subunit [Gammaproteobacteria bacterium]|nr:glutamine-hydrolyzing carbamoyl-phosphate synthase small subunit [Gammaproteobacteria bacterium]